MLNVTVPLLELGIYIAVLGFITKLSIRGTLGPLRISLSSFECFFKIASQPLSVFKMPVFFSFGSNKKWSEISDKKGETSPVFQRICVPLFIKFNTQLTIKYKSFYAIVSFAISFAFHIFTTHTPQPKCTKKCLVSLTLEKALQSCMSHYTSTQKISQSCDALTSRGQQS